MHSVGLENSYRHTILKMGDRKDPLNYRHISLTRTISKTCEDIIAHRMRTHLQEYHLLTECHHGPRKHHSWESQLIHTISDLFQCNNSNIHVNIIVLNLKNKALDTGSCSQLILKLKYYNFIDLTALRIKMGCCCAHLM